ncbi:bifunctional diguanylate cyclase/phosphodiesterase [Thiorhodovibrio frisius]|uniref:Diguanylate cyclase (GGDEF) domain-containing protein n=1 Tax=Thiorhodovibrio frisius TaxID=631362 RepID=H8Z872_9GAMM|nr:GGDEF domain-containing protein [Thiorhodovibrio frisius]EIC21021.1 diguanylate cyclase (GGDEF) domain-containing protein [Thiorhodovibrio frisius]WPL22077.1 Bacteriophytochrome cph2 [Thiorhodovibrio frisius]
MTFEIAPSSPIQVSHSPDCSFGLNGFSVANLCERLDYAFQPIVNIHTGAVFGFEALLRGLDNLGFRTVDGLFSAADGEGVLLELESALRDKAIASFARIPDVRHARLLFNLDSRSLINEPRWGHLTDASLKRHGLAPATLCFELTELHDLTAHPEAQRAVEGLRQQRFLFAIDDFGTGYSGLKLLYEFPPDLVKIDRFFISSISRDHKRRLFVENAVHLAHTLGVQVVAEGVETADELTACRDIGCDLAQGFFIARPSTDIPGLSTSYPIVPKTVGPSRRQSDSDSTLIRSRIEQLPALTEDSEMREVFDLFKRHSEYSFFPVLDKTGKPLGLVCEKALKRYIYSSYGRELLANSAYRKQLLDFLSPCPSLDINNPVERLLEAYTAANSPPGMIMTENFGYAGFISQAALLQILDSKNLAAARDQNPLTRLPGNNSIIDYVQQVLEDARQDYCLVYFDFDNFKPFNDTYGFRIGDRAIALFADLLRKMLPTHSCFIGHVGGDDFFAGFREPDRKVVKGHVSAVLAQFKHEALSLYDSATRERGYIEALTREGQPARLPLLACSAALLWISGTVRDGTLDDVSRVIAKQKKAAKASPDGLAEARLQAAATPTPTCKEAMVST